MKAILPWVLLTSIPALISADFIIADLKHQKKRSVDGHPTKQVKELEIYSFKVDCKITSRFARNVVTSRVVNRANESKEALFDVQLPKTAFIANFSMIIDGVVYVGVVKEKEVAKQQYQQAVARGQTAGLVKVTGRKMEKFKVSVNIAAAKKVTFELVYEELLKRKLGKYEMVIRVKPEQLVQHFQIDVHLFEPQGIAFLDVNATFLTNDLMPIVKKTLTGKKAHISFTPTLDQQSACTSCQNTGPHGPVRVCAVYVISQRRKAHVQLQPRSRARPPTPTRRTPRPRAAAPPRTPGPPHPPTPGRRLCPVNIVPFPV
ncbi:inter-alpha-trypsin inhibitor heavy chain H3-like [Callorhinchus milii]|uniref:inter-alpha-trypsin inhibitor heavy chain H3-like n=1 Tax=Callorhinchus milii TaxID=7868 RepID=UPI001C3F7C68|nr:inter-alpha-trypsin inhibitor heavy chain H3-like [Callorhinchus milii]